EGLADLVNHIFRSLPSDVSLAAMQQALVDARKSSRLAFVITEASGIMSAIVVMDGKSTDEIRVMMLLLYAIICNHYSVDEKTWLRFNGDALEIGKHVEAQGKSKRTVDRRPVTFIEWF